jgi:TP901 family phage tail tape measure protein
MAVVVPVISTFDAKGITKAIADFKRLETTGQKTTYALRTMDKAAVTLSKSLMKAGLGAAAVGGYAVKQFANFDAAMNKSVSIMGDVSESMRTEMADAARQMSKQSTFSATEAAESFFFLASAGLSAEQSIKALPIVTTFAQAGMFDMALATDLLTDAQSALGLSIRDDVVANMKNMTRVSDVLVKANTIANATVQQFSESLTNKAGASMRSLNIDMEEGVAVLATFADQGIKGSQAGTTFNAVLRGLIGGVQRFPEVFKSFNIEVFNSAGELNNLASIIGQMETAFGGMSTEQRRAALTQLGFTEETLAGTLALLGNSDSIARYEDTLRNAGGTADEVAKKQLQTLSAQITILKNQFVDIAISIGQSLEPKIQRLVEIFQTMATVVSEQGVGAGFKYLTGQFLEMTGNMGALGNTILGLTAAFTALRLVTIAATISQVAFNTALFANPIGIAVAAVIVLGVALVALMIKFKGLRDVFINTWNMIVTGLQKYINFALGIYEFFINGFIDGVNIIIKGWNKIPFVKKVAEIEQVNLALDITGLKIDNLTKKTGQFNMTLSQMQEMKGIGNFAGTGSDPAGLAGLTTGFEGVTSGAKATGKAIETASQKFKKFKDQAKDLVSTQRSYSDALKGTKKAQDDLQKTTDALAKAQERFNKVSQGFGSGSKEASDAQQDLTEANRAATRAQFDLEKANYAVTDAEKALREARRTGTARDIREAEIALQEAIISQAEAQENLTAAVDAQQAAQTRLNETINGASTTSDTYKNALVDLKSAQDAQADAIDRVRDAKIRELDVTRNLAKAEILLRKARGKLTKAQLKTANQLLKDLSTPISVDVPTVSGVVPLASGGIVTRPTLSLIGEGGEPEAVIPLSKMRDTMGGGVTVNIQTGVGDPVEIGRQVVTALQAYQRRSGSLPLKVG